MNLVQTDLAISSIIFKKNQLIWRTLKDIFFLFEDLSMIRNVNVCDTKKKKRKKKKEKKKEKKKKCLKPRKKEI